MSLRPPREQTRPRRRSRHLPALALGALVVLLASPVAAASIRFVDNNRGDFAARGWLEPHSAFQQNIKAAVQLWGQIDPNSRSMTVEVRADRTAPRLNATFPLATRKNRTAPATFGPKPLGLILAGTHPSGQVDILLSVNAPLLESEFWLDPTPGDSTDDRRATAMTSWVDIALVDVALRELGHGLGVAGSEKLRKTLSEFGLTVGNCSPEADNLCLNSQRFDVSVDWTDFAGNSGDAMAVPFGSDDSGLLYFFDPDNWEMLIKVLDGCALNGHYWVFAAATTNVEYTMRVRDTETGVVKIYENALGTASPAITDTTAFATCPGGKSRTPPSDVADLSISPAIVVSASAGPLQACTATEDNLCLNQERFKVEVDFTDFSAQSGVGKVVPFGSDDSGLFYFFEPDNWEMLVKVLNGCTINGNFWVFSAATTNVEYTLRVTDSQTGQVKEYFNAAGSAAPAITDTSAFATCP